MALDRSRRRLVLFALVVALPCVVLIGLTIHALRQERELHEKRRADEETRRAREVRELVISRLDRARLSMAAGEPIAGAVVLGRIVGDRLILSWEGSPDSTLEDPSFRSQAMRGERIEFGEGGPERAIPLYRDLLGKAKTASQESAARLLLARALTRAGRIDEGVDEYRRLLQAPLSDTDEEDVPVALYAAEALWDLETDRRPVIERVERGAGELSADSSPTTLHLLARLLRKIEDSSAGAEAALAAVTRRLERADRALETRRDWERLQTIWQPDSPGSASPRAVWVLHGDPPRLVSRIATPEGDVVASLEPASLFREVSRNRPDLTALRFADGWSDGTLNLAPWVRGARLVLPEPPAAEEPRSAYRSVVVGALLAVLVATLLSAFLLWYDIRREVRLAKLRSRFVSSVSHELKTPLTSIRMFAESLSLGRPRDPERRTEYLETIVGESERLSRLIDNVLDFSKIEQGKKEYRPRPMNLDDSVRAALRALQYPLKEQRFDIHLEVNENLPPVLGDPDALEQAVLNLLANAMKYSGTSRTIALRLEQRNGHAVLEIEDRGIGIPERDRERIFEEFYRAPSEELEAPGTGLGLTIVSHVAREHGGRVTVESEPGKGSTFGLWIPLEETS